MRLKTPPYAAAHARAAKAGFAPAAGVVFVFDGWPQAEWITEAKGRGAWCAAIPPDRAADELDWSWCAGFDILLITPAPSRAEKLKELLQAKRARHIDVLLVAHDGWAIFGVLGEFWWHA